MANYLDPAVNFAFKQLSTGISAGATSLTLSTGQGASLPDPSTDGEFNGVIYCDTDYQSPAEDPDVEVVRVTAKSSDTLTITRAQEGTSAVAHNGIGKSYRIVVGPTKKLRDDIENYIQDSWQFVEEITFTNESGIKTTSNFTNPTTIFKYKIIFNVENNYPGNNIPGINVNGISTSVYGWGNNSLTAFSAVGGLSSGQGSCGIAYFTASGQSVSGEIYINAQKDTGNIITFYGSCGGSAPTLAVFNSGYGNIGASFSSVENISILAGQNITGKFKIYRLPL